MWQNRCRHSIFLLFAVSYLETATRIPRTLLQTPCFNLESFEEFQLLCCRQGTRSEKRRWNGFKRRKSGKVEVHSKTAATLLLITAEGCFIFDGPFISFVYDIFDETTKLRHKINFGRNPAKKLINLRRLEGCLLVSSTPRQTSPQNLTEVRS